MHWDTFNFKQDDYSTVGGHGGCRVGELRVGTTPPMPDHKGLSYRNCQRSSPYGNGQMADGHWSKIKSELIADMVTAINLFSEGYMVTFCEGYMVTFCEGLSAVKVLTTQKVISMGSWWHGNIDNVKGG